MKRPSAQTFAAAGVVALLALVAIVTSRNEPPPDNPYASTDYGTGGYRAWATLLAREGVGTARFVQRPIELDRRIDTLVSAQPPRSDPAARTAADIGALAAWVRTGGRLVYLGRNPALGEAETQLLELPYFLPDVGARGTPAGPFATQVRALHGLGTNRMLLVEHSGEAVLSDGNGDIVVRYPFGHGEIVAAVDAGPFTNANIAQADNARLAYLLTAPRRPGGIVAFDDGLHGALVDRPWYRALPVPVRVSFGIVAFAALLALIGSALRGSPAMRLEPAREPSSVEFVNALAALYERTAMRDAARTVLARAALAAVARSAGVGDDGSPEMLAGRIGDRGDAGVRRLVRLLATPVTSDEDLLASARLAHSVRKDSTYGASGDGRRAAFAGRTRTRRRW